MICASCNEPIVGGYVYHHRLGVYVHGTDECMRDVRGEDIRLHTVRWIPTAAAVYAVPNKPKDA